MNVLNAVICAPFAARLGVAIVVAGCCLFAQAGFAQTTDGLAEGAQAAQSTQAKSTSQGRCVGSFAAPTDNSAGNPPGHAHPHEDAE